MEEGGAGMGINFISSKEKILTYLKKRLVWQLKA
jgi:hypothetical protein